jgi:hypothetical protein
MTGILGALIGSFRRLVGGPAYELIATTRLTATAANVQFTDLNVYSNDYKHLQIRYSAQSTGAGVAINVTFNGVTTSSYARHWLQGEDSTVSSSGQSGNNNIGLIGSLARSTVSNSFVGGIIDILDAFSQTKNTTIRSLNGTSNGNISTVTLNSGLFVNTNPIDSITLTPSSVLFAVNSRFSIYGIKG